MTLSPTPRAAPASETAPTGTVAETMSSGGYTYARLDTGVWLAGPMTPLGVGARIHVSGAMKMAGFHSNTLNRTFDEIYFVSAITSDGAAAAAAPSPASDALSGTVVETMRSGGYTYARLDTGAWIAGPETAVAVGAAISATGATKMTGFHSDTLNRTFDAIFFVSAITAGAGPANRHDAATAPATVAHVDPVAGGKTVADVFAGKAALAGKAVAVRGKVVKVTNDILGKNWLHLQDGTGAAGTNDLLVTTTATANVGDVVVARGTVALDKDFGAGYRYAVLVEDAAITP
jgi:hypothetical protein